MPQDKKAHSFVAMGHFRPAVTEMHQLIESPSVIIDLLKENRPSSCASTRWRPTCLRRRGPAVHRPGASHEAPSARDRERPLRVKKNMPKVGGCAIASALRRMAMIEQNRMLAFCFGLSKVNEAKKQDGPQSVYAFQRILRHASTVCHRYNTKQGLIQGPYLHKGGVSFRQNFSVKWFVITASWEGPVGGSVAIDLATPMPCL